MWHLHKLEEEIAEWKAEVSALQKRKEDGEAAANDTLQTLNTLQNEKGDLEEQLCKLQGRHEQELHGTKLELERQQEDLRVELRASNKTNEKLQIDFESFRGQFDGLQGKHAETLDSFSTENLDHQATKGELESRTNELVKAKGEKNACESAIRKITNELKDAKIELMNVKTELAQMHVRPSELECDLWGKTTELSESQNELDRMCSQLCQAKTHLQEKDMEISEASMALEDIGHQISKSKTDLEDKARQLSQARDELKEKANLLSEAIAELKDKDVQLSETKIELEENASQLSQARTHLKERDNQISETKTGLENKARELSRPETEIEEKASEISRPKAELESKAAQLSEVTVQLMKVETLQNAAEIEIAHVKEVTSTESKIEKGQTQLGKVQNTQHQTQCDTETPIKDVTSANQEQLCTNSDNEAKVDNKPKTDDEFRLNGEDNISPASGAAEGAHSADESTSKEETKRQLGGDEVESEMSQLKGESSVSSPPSEATSHPVDHPIHRRSFRFRTAGELASSSHNVRRKYRLELKAHEKEIERTKTESAPSSRSASDRKDAGLNASAGWFHPGIVPVPGKVIERSGGLVKPKEPKPVCKYGPRRKNGGLQQSTTQRQRPSQVPHCPQQRAFQPSYVGFRPGNNSQQNHGNPISNAAGNYAAYAELLWNSSFPAPTDFPADNRSQQNGRYLDSAWAPNH